MHGLAFKAWLKSYALQENHPSLVMGILNVTSDSFSDGTKYLNLEKAKSRVLDMIEQGVDLIDIGAESSRPGATPVEAELEIERLLPLLEWIRTVTDICISVDTHKTEVMRECLASGADMINDIFALRQPGALDIILQHDCPVCLMHVQGEIKDFGHTIDPNVDMIEVITRFFQQRMTELIQAGLNSNLIVLDPGLGFGKNTQQNLAIMKNLDKLKNFNRPILLGLSRKRFIGDVLAKEVMEREIGSLAANQYGLMQGARIFRTHDVASTKQMISMVQAISAA